MNTEIESAAELRAEMRNEIERLRSEYLRLWYAANRVCNASGGLDKTSTEFDKAKADLWGVMCEYKP